MHPPAEADSPHVEVLDDASAAIWASKTGAERLAVAAAMFRSARRMMESHLRAEHPSWDTAQVDAEILRRFDHGPG
jgi:hypothetical protein